MNEDGEYEICACSWCTNPYIYKPGVKNRLKQEKEKYFEEQGGEAFLTAEIKKGKMGNLKKIISGCLVSSKDKDWQNFILLNEQGQLHRLIYDTTFKKVRSKVYSEEELKTVWLGFLTFFVRVGKYYSHKKLFILTLQEIFQHEIFFWDIVKQGLRRLTTLPQYSPMKELDYPHQEWYPPDENFYIFPVLKLVVYMVQYIPYASQSQKVFDIMKHTKSAKNQADEKEFFNFSIKKISCESLKCLCKSLVKDIQSLLDTAPMQDQNIEQIIIENEELLRNIQLSDDFRVADDIVRSQILADIRSNNKEGKYREENEINAFYEYKPYYGHGTLLEDWFPEKNVTTPPVRLTIRKNILEYSCNHEFGIFYWFDNSSIYYAHENDAQFFVHFSRRLTTSGSSYCTSSFS